MDEPDGSVTATIGASSRYTGGGASATVAVRDDDATPTLSAPQGVAASCGADTGRLSVVWTVAQSNSIGRHFDIEANDVTVAVPYAIGLVNLEWNWAQAESGETYQIRVRERTSTSAGDGTIVTELSPWVSTSVTCDRFVPQDFEVSCNARGVVEAHWDAVNGAGSYQVEWLPQHETGSNEVRTVTTANPTWQADEGGIYKLRARAYSTAATGWSNYTEQQTVACQEVSFPSHQWLSPNGPLGDPDTEITGTVLISRFCPTTRVGNRTERTCTEVWEETVTIRVDQRQWWKRLPLADWSDQYSVRDNILTLAALVDAIAVRRRAGQSERSGSNFSIAIGGSSQANGYARITANERVFLAVTSRPPQPIVGCLPPRYTTRNSTLDRQTSTTGNHTTHRDITIHYCERS